MKRRTVVLEVEIEGERPDAMDLRDEVLRFRQVIGAEVINDGVGRRPQWRIVRTGGCRFPLAHIGGCGCRDITITEERQGAA
jgi:hypothetical protein